VCVIRRRVCACDLTRGYLYFVQHGYFYFVDRIGDTFRWKGENVATSEVELVIDSVPGVSDTNVYGVEVPGHDGRAGMASLTTNSTFSLAELYSRIRAELPTYAQPLFLRIQPEMDLTGTFKHKKFDLQAQGFNPDLVKVWRLLVAREQHRSMLTNIAWPAAGAAVLQRRCCWKIHRNHSGDLPAIDEWWLCQVVNQS
jgi:hypothetical protein